MFPILSSPWHILFYYQIDIRLDIPFKRLNISSSGHKSL